MKQKLKTFMAILKLVGIAYRLFKWVRSKQIGKKVMSRKKKPYVKLPPRV